MTTKTNVQPRDSGHEPSENNGVIHVYDGIEECDNHLPRWWLYVLFGTIVFAGGYWLYYHDLKQGKLPVAEYNEEKARQLAKEAEALREAGEVTPELLTSLSKDPKTTEMGAATFAEVCVTCHGAGAVGGAGPNLTDNYWLHGGDPLSVYKTVREGWQDKMPAWGKVLGENKTRTVVAYVLTLKGTNATGGKEPQGIEEKK